MGSTLKSGLRTFNMLF